ncbi:MAG: Uma2 family endonuclease [bacterium]|nr:Uma2 family endonuclease [bacterium]
MAETATISSPQKHEVSLEEFRNLPEGPPDYEFEEGEVIPLARPHGRHQLVLIRLGAALVSYITQRKAGRIWPEIDVELTERKSYVPDLVYLAQEHLDRMGNDGKIHGAPDLVVEVSSPGTVSRDRVTKFNAYLEAGVSWYWIIDPQELTIEEYNRHEDGYYWRTKSIDAGDVFRPDLFPGLELNLKEMMEG